MASSAFPYCDPENVRKVVIVGGSGRVSTVPDALIALSNASPDFQFFANEGCYPSVPLGGAFGADGSSNGSVCKLACTQFQNCLRHDEVYAMAIRLGVMPRSWADGH